MQWPLGRDGDRHRGESRLTWERAKEATRDSWNRLGNAVERAMPGDSDGDGRRPGVAPGTRGDPSCACLLHDCTKPSGANLRELDRSIGDGDHGVAGAVQRLPAARQLPMTSTFSTRPGTRAAVRPSPLAPADQASLTTETPSECHPDLDCYAVPELVDAFIDDQWHALKAVRAAGPKIAEAVAAAVPRIAGGGRLVYVGAGTSGRLGVLDSVELYPTFSWPKDRAVALLAGGQQAMFEAVEGAEDSLEQGRLDLTAVDVNDKDVVILLAASGATPYVMGALEAARALGALTIGIANNPAAPVTLGADVAITLNTGSEVISGSTRLKAGTSQKIALNTLSSAIMVRLNKVYGNLMVDLQPTNAKLLRRAISLTMRATGANEETARQALAACGYQVKIAIVAILMKVDVAQAEARLAATHGSVRAAMAQGG